MKTYKLPVIGGLLSGAGFAKVEAFHLPETALALTVFGGLGLLLRYAWRNRGHWRWDYRRTWR